MIAPAVGWMNSCGSVPDWYTPAPSPWYVFTILLAYHWSWSESGLPGEDGRHHYIAWTPLSLGRSLFHQHPRFRLADMGSYQMLLRGFIIMWYAEPLTGVARSPALLITA
jgi:hypothetical protein